jgi:hypothetical protein
MMKQNHITNKNLHNRVNDELHYEWRIR